MEELKSNNNFFINNKAKINVGAVNYLNTKPLIYGFERGGLQEEINLSFDYPANIAEQLMSRQIDVGLLPVAVLPKIKNYNIITNYCIGCNGAVASVGLFSDVPLHQIKIILLDYQSKTSVALLKILCHEHWKISPQIIRGKKNFEKNIGHTTAGLVIGDRAFVQTTLSKYHYDLGAAWKEMTGLPFVFATWVSYKKLPDKFITQFNSATALGLNYIDEIVKSQHFTLYNLQHYYTQNINYVLDEPKLKALFLFLKKMEAL